MKLLVLGGTVFVGRHIVQVALAHGHEITLFNRGKSNPHLFPSVEKIRGDRHSDLRALDGRTWDAVVDTYGYYPNVVRKLATTLAAQTAHYTFISSTCVYSDFRAPDIIESHAVRRSSGTDLSKLSRETYGTCKAACERAVESSFPNSALIVRPGVVVGPSDYTDLLTYWIRRIAEGGSVVAPGNPDQIFQILDVRDLASWVIRMVERRMTGSYNIVGPDTPITWGELLETCRVEVNKNARLIWVPESILVDQSVIPFAEMPLWLPRSQLGFYRISASRALSEKLTLRSIADTIRDTHYWAQNKDPKELIFDRVLTDPETMAKDKEAKLLRIWNNAPKPFAPAFSKSHWENFTQEEPWPCT